MKHALTLVAALSAGTLCGCLGTGPQATIQPTYSSLAKHVFTGCSTQGCHGGATPQANLNLEPGQGYAALVGVQPQNQLARAEGLLRVAAGDPDKSFLLVKLHPISKPAFGAQMPLGGRLSEAEIAVLHQWVEKGAPND